MQRGGKTGTNLNESTESSRIRLLIFSRVANRIVMHALYERRGVFLKTVIKDKEQKRDVD